MAEKRFAPILGDQNARMSMERTGTRSVPIQGSLSMELKGGAAGAHPYGICGLITPTEEGSQC